MITRDLAVCNRSYNFHPLNKWPLSLPMYSWGYELLCGFEAKQPSIVLDLKSNEIKITDVLFSLYPQLSLSELARLYSLMKSHPDADWLDFSKTTIFASVII